MDICTFVVCVDNGPKPLLACSVPYLQLNDFVVDFEGFKSEIYADRDHVVLVELVIGET